MEGAISNVTHMLPLPEIRIVHIHGKSPYRAQKRVPYFENPRRLCRGFIFMQDYVFLLEVLAYCP